MDHSKFTFPSPYDSKNYQNRKSVTELRLMSASQQIRERNGWREDLKNDEIVSAWREEAKSNGLQPGEFTTVLEQLKYYDSLATGLVQVGGTRQADNLLSEELKKEFVDGLNGLLDKKDYYPGTDNLVVNLIDPSLYCSVSGVTRITDFDFDVKNCLRNIGNGKVITENVGIRYLFSTVPVVFQLLPAEFHVNKAGK